MLIQQLMTIERTEDNAHLCDDVAVVRCVNSTRSCIEIEGTDDESVHVAAFQCKMKPPWGRK
jgi:hypothetical protein